MTHKYSSILIAIYFSLASAGAASAERVDQWEVMNFKTGIYATDCRNCEEDRGIDMECKFGSSKVAIEVPIAATEHGVKGARTHAIIQVGGWRRLYKGRTELMELIGYYPTFKVDVSSPIFSRLAAGRTASITYRGETSKISLKGSAKALERFLSACRSRVAKR